jgi:tRNA1Val (adenine37-N6)-methyltransferase
MGVFHFKKFDVRDDRSAMKVGTDGVLLGAAAEVAAKMEIVLDIGTGCGLVALMLAQRLAEAGAAQFHIQGIDIEEGAAADAAENFRQSPWGEHLESMNISLKAFDEAFPDAAFDLIASNPPYYDNSLEAPEGRRNIARHVGNAEYSCMEVLSYKEILEYAVAHLRDAGSLWLILPADQENDLLRFARMLGLAPFKILRIRSVSRKPPFRIIAGFGKSRSTLDEDELVLLDEKGRRTSEHVSLTNDFYL